MNSEREKLIEIWLDNAGERQYQFAFRNALLVAGNTILHDTSHTALELGKDILAITPQGELMAYQLKGTPGGRLTISQWHDLIPQINALIYQPVSHPSVKPGTPHTPVLVTNGEIHEDVQAAIAGYNSMLAVSQPQARPLQTIARGQMLKLVLESAHTLWPVHVSIQRNILNVFASPGDDELPIQAIVDILSDVLKGKHTEVAIPSLHLVASIVSSNWIEKRNYFELVKMYALLAVSACCYQAQWKKKRAKDDRFIEEIVIDLRSHLRSFISDLTKNYLQGPLINSNAFAEFGYFHPRKRMISGLASVALLDNQLDFDATTRDFLWTLVCKSKHSKFMLWEGIVPFCLAEFWALSNFQGTKEPDRRLFALLSDILQCNDQETEHNQLPGPYYSLREVVEWKYKLFLRNFRSDIDRDNHYRRSSFAEPLFFLLVRRNYKSACQALWPTLSKFVHIATRLPGPTSFGPARCDAALSEDKIIDVTTQRNWDDVIIEASATSDPPIPPQLRARPIVVLLYCLFVPQRMTPDVVLWLDRVFCKSWY